MKKSKQFILKQKSSDKINLQNVRRIILKVVVGLSIISIIFFVAVNIAHKKLSQLSETVSAILEPNTKLIKLKELSGCLYDAESNIKAYTIRHDTAYLLNYENYINYINIRLDTLLYLSSKGGIVDLNQEKDDQYFSAQIDTLKKLIICRVNLFSEYIEIKTGESSRDVFLQLLKKIQINKTVAKINHEQKTEIPKRSFFAQLFSSKQNNEDTSTVVIAAVSSDSVKGSIQNIITQTQQEEKINEGKQLSKEIDIAQREQNVMNHIFSLVKSMEKKELVEGINRIHAATKETNSEINFISNGLTAFGLLLAFMFFYFIYRDIKKANNFKEQLLLVKRNAEKLASQYSLSLIEASLDPLVTINSEGKIMDMNEALVNITGITRDELKGTDFFNYFTEQQKAREVYQEVFAKGSVADFPLTLHHKDGKLTDVLFNGSVYKDDKGNVLGVVVVARDITEQKRFENELIESKRNAELATQKAEESNKLKEAFLANMSHEIRTPMNAIIGFSDILFKKKLGEQEKEYVKTIKIAGENLLTIINDILDISKIEAGMMTFEEHAFSVKEIFKSLSVMLMEKAKEKNLELSFSCDNDIPDIMLGDDTRLSQIIINLAGNAIKFTKEGNVKVHAYVNRILDETIFMEFSVTDTGIGIPEDKLEQIFERFRQAESHTTRKFGGTGLGLSIAKQLVELQNGTLSVKSEFNVGSVFSFCIPYKRTSQTHMISDTIENKYNIEDLTKLNILLVEDNNLNVLLIKSLFSENNLKIQTAENGSVCIEKIKETSFDIILMDMEMPVLNGYDTTIIIRNELKNNIPIIAMTAHAMAGEKERCLSLGMNDYISKPINANLLFEKMYNLTIKS